MIAMIARFHAQPGKEADVRRALEDMVIETAEHDPEMPAYAVLVDEEDPGAFAMYAQYSSVRDRLPAHREEEVLKMGTALRESLLAPIEIRRFSVVRALSSERAR